MSGDHQAQEEPECVHPTATNLNSEFDNVSTFSSVGLRPVLEPMEGGDVYRTPMMDTAPSARCSLATRFGGEDICHLIFEFLNPVEHLALWYLREDSFCSSRHCVPTQTLQRAMKDLVVTKERYNEDDPSDPYTDIWGYQYLWSGRVIAAGQVECRRLQSDAANPAVMERVVSALLGLTAFRPTEELTFYGLRVEWVECPSERELYPLGLSGSFQSCHGGELDLNVGCVRMPWIAGAQIELVAVDAEMMV
eukprot:gene23380-9650_t